MNADQQRRARMVGLAFLLLSLVLAGSVALQEGGAVG
jgi:hypothetical protein